ncbi:hypothetical protein [Archangium lansingense]|uniref:Lipoprotein n=1 Tax=Archangium lansingense TaxID=2995310 RepID=A0ABT4AGM6_9BACT|nr:hypothetical protein [Archangium lansinium]MCY1080821.1 hypothetical protein [Archangium lansinium]
MRNELSLLRNMWPAVFLGTALVSGCERVDAAPAGPPSTGTPGTVERSVEEGSPARSTPVHAPSGTSP